MILDNENLFSKAQAITTSAVSTNVIDLGPNMWAGHSAHDMPLPIFLAVVTAFTDTGSDATLTVQVQSSNDEAFGSGVVTHMSRTLAFADLDAAGEVMKHGLAIPEDALRYVRLNYTVANGPFTAGTLTAGLTMSRQTNR